MSIKDLIRKKIGELQSNEFEKFCCRLLEAGFEEYKEMESSLNWYNSSTSGTPDAYIRDAQGRYTLFQFTVEKNNIRQKVLKDIAKIEANKDRFDPIKKVVFCISSPFTQIVGEFYKKCESLGWEAEDFSLDKLTHLAEKNPLICSDYLGIVPVANSATRKNLQSERYYDCGIRLREVREDIALVPSQFIELIDYSSEKIYKEIESSIEECGEQLLEKVRFRTGASLEWLKHGINDKYPTERYWMLPDHALNEIADEYPKKVILTIQKQDLSIKMLVHFEGYSWKKYDLRLKIDFWNWMDDHRYIPQFYRLLERLESKFYNNFLGVILTEEEDDFIFNPKTHPASLKDLFFRGHNYWVSHILDLDIDNDDKKKYAYLYGEWFSNVQREFIRLRPHLKEETKQYL